ncbi:MAG: YdcF family protein [Oscillatoriales cyanobacterium C42_A2020_001]|nr:YdcF family protein [Leptolyngbyaceae cyanobacterium C42_A2020_001]
MISREHSKRQGQAPKIRILVWTLLLLPLLWMGYRWGRSYFIQPEAILVLGGDLDREHFAASFAREHPDLPVWISGGSNEAYAEGVFADAGIDFTRLHIDRTAQDTVTNFTTLVDKLQVQGISSVYLITSDYHMQRARVIGEIVFGSRDMYLKPIPVPSQRDSEPVLKSVRDGARAVLWVTTGHTGSTLQSLSNKP